MSPSVRTARVAVLDDYQDVALEMADWTRLGSGVELQVFCDHLKDASAVAARLSRFDAVVAMRERTPFPGALLERLPALRLLVTTGMANASIDLGAATRLGIVVSGTRGLDYPAAELTWGLILAAVRCIPHEDQAVRDGRWQTTVGTGLRGKVLGVIGLGRLGSQVASIGRAFGMSVVAWSQNLTAERATECGATLVSKDDVLRRADIVTVHLKLSQRTTGVIGARELRLMKPTAYLVNTSRGSIVDEAALVEALSTGAIAGAALDVFDDEPLPANHAFRRMDRVVITPHLGYVIREGYQVYYGDAVENLRTFFEGRPARVLNPEVLTSSSLRGAAVSERRS